jgi:hypothetical protein
MNVRRLALASILTCEDSEFEQSRDLVYPECAVAFAS